MPRLSSTCAPTANTQAAAMTVQRKIGQRHHTKTAADKLKCQVLHTDLHSKSRDALTSTLIVKPV